MKNEPQSVFMLKLNQQILKILRKQLSAVFVCPLFFPSRLVVNRNSKLQIVGKSTHLHRIDVYSLGIVMSINQGETLS